MTASKATAAAMDANEFLQAGGFVEGYDPFDDAKPMGSQGPGEEMDSIGLPPTYASLLQPTWEECLRWQSGDVQAIPTPWPSLNKRLPGGFVPGLHYLVGRPKDGKTGAAIQVAHHAASKGVPVLYVALELTHREVATRLVTVLSPREWWSRLCYGKAPKDAIDAAFRHAQENPLAAPVYLGGRIGDYDSVSLMAEAQRVRQGHPDGPLLVVLDYLQRMRGDDRDLRISMRNASSAARNLAAKHDAAVLVVSATARDKYQMLTGKAGGKLGEGEADRLMGTGKESGDLEYDAESVLALCRESRRSDRVYLAVAAARSQGESEEDWHELEVNGPTFVEPLRFQGEEV